MAYYKSYEAYIRRAVVHVHPVCAYCKGVSTQADHIYPTSLGGESTECNLIGCCAKCNSKKGNKIIESTVLRELQLTAWVSWPMVREVVENTYGLGGECEVGRLQTIIQKSYTKLACVAVQGEEHNDNGK